MTRCESYPPCFGTIYFPTAPFCFSTKDILKIRSRPRLEPGSDYHYLVRLKKS